jgi:hypothetical protein
VQDFSDLERKRLFSPSGSYPVRLASGPEATLAGRRGEAWSTGGVAARGEVGGGDRGVARMRAGVWGRPRARGKGRQVPLIGADRGLAAPSRGGHRSNASGGTCGDDGRWSQGGEEPGSKREEEYVWEKRLLTSMLDVQTPLPEEVGGARI